MRPRGLSRSSPRITYVEQTAVQNPQCTQRRRMRSASANRGFSNCWGVKFVCIGLVSIVECQPGTFERVHISKVGVHAARIQDAGGIERVLEAAGELVEPRLERLEYLDLRTHG